MVFAIVLAGLHLLALAVSALDPAIGRGVFTLEQTAIGAVVLAWTPARRAMIAALAQYWPAAIAFAAAFAVAAWQAGLLGGTSIAFNPFAARGEIWNLAALFFAMAATAALAGIAGRRPVHNAMLVVAVMFTAFDAIGKLQFGPDHGILATPGETAAVYGLFALLALFVAYDELTSPQMSTGPGHLGKRMLLPGVTFLVTTTGFLLADASQASPAFAAGIGLMLVLLAFRSMPSALGLGLGGAGLASLLAAVPLAMAYETPDDPFGANGLDDSFLTALKGASGLGSDIGGGMLQSWPVEAGLWGAGAMATAVFLMFTRLAATADRRRAPSRGLALGLGAAALAALAGAGGSSPAATATLAILVGLAGSYSDRLRVGARRTSRRSEPAAAFADSASVAV